MKLINYKRGYNNTFGCSIHGTIKMERSKFDEVVAFLYRTRRWCDNTYDLNYWKRILSDDLANRVDIKKNGMVVSFLVNVRVSATEAIAKKWELDNYKLGNYQLLVTE